MTADDVVERIKKNLGIPWNAQTYRDTFKAGSPETEVKGIATTFMATLDLLQRAHAAGMNFVITHEPTFWSDADTTKEFADDPIYRFKVDFCQQEQYGGLAIPRSHTRAPAGSDLGWAGARAGMGRTARPRPTSADSRFRPPRSGALAADVKRRLNARALRVVGDPQRQSEHRGGGHGLQHAAHLARCRRGDWRRELLKPAAPWTPPNMCLDAACPRPEQGPDHYWATQSRKSPAWRTAPTGCVPSSPKFRSSSFAQANRSGLRKQEHIENRRASFVWLACAIAAPEVDKLEPPNW